MADFSQYSNFNKSANFTSVRWGAQAKILETELNEMQDIQNEARADIIRESIPSGFTKLGAIDYTTMSSTPNTIRLGEESVAFVNGNKITIPAGTVITLNAPPTSGAREDLVFLEVWKEEIDSTEVVNKYGGDGQGTVTNHLKDNRVGIETSRRVQTKYRLRVVDGVNFNNPYPDGVGGVTGGANMGVSAQGGNQFPIPTPISNNNNGFSWCGYSGLTGKTTHAQFTGDNGLYVAGDGTQSYRNSLMTLDGYSYAIPMFRVRRRNSGEYSVENANGTSRYLYIIDNSYTATDGIITVNVTDSSRVSIGEVLNPGAYSLTVVDIIDSTHVKLKMGWSASTIGNARGRWVVSNNRPDSLHADIIVDRDIIDLRHQVSLTGFNYDKLLAENFDRFLRGELQPKKVEMKKTYFGIGKTPIDANTVFYASLDGTTTAEVGDHDLTAVLGNPGYKAGATGLSAIINPDHTRQISIATINKSEGTVDMWVDTNNLVGVGNATVPYFVAFADEANRNIFTAYINISANKISLESLISDGNYYNNINATATGFMPYNMGIAHLRIRWKDNDGLYLYVNGVKRAEYKVAGQIFDRQPQYVRIGDSFNVDRRTKMPVSDLSISNIDRGNTFLTLPRDFIDGYADIVPAFNPQRKTYGEPLMSQYTLDVVKISGSNPKQITNSRTSGNWASGDTVKVKGLGGEMISGVIDSDTALARVVKTTINSNIIYLDDVGKLSVGDPFRFYRFTDGYMDTVTLNVQSIDSVNKSITISQNITADASWAIIETTASSSSPVVKANIGGTPTTVGGTWSGLGTNETTFTLGTNATLTNQDLVIEYSLNAPSGQGQIPVYERTLGGEYRGKKLVVNPSVHVSDDFAGKVSGSVTENPNKSFRVATAATLKSPSEFTVELATTDSTVGYDRISVLSDGKTLSQMNTLEATIPQQLFSFNIIEILERKFGTLPCGQTLAEKVAWVKANINDITTNWWGYGVANGTNRTILGIYYLYNNTWLASASTANGSVTKLSAGSKNISTTPSTAMNNMIDANGFVHFLAYTDAVSQAGNTATIYTDYCNIEITLKTPTGYNVVTSEDPRRDAGKSNILLVRKETREVQTMFPATNEDNIALYGEYLPQESLAPTDYVTILAEGDGFLVSDLSSAVGDKQGTHHWRNILYKLRNDNVNLLGEFGYGRVAYSADSKGINVGAKVKISSAGFNDNATVQYGLTTLKKPLVALARYLVNHSGELKLLVVSRYAFDGSVKVYNDGVALLLPLVNKPLLKAQEGTLRSAQGSSTAWLTPSEEIQGYVNSEGQLVVAYQ